MKMETNEIGNLQWSINFTPEVLLPLNVFFKRYFSGYYMHIQGVQALHFELLYKFLNFEFLCGVEILLVDTAYTRLISVA